MRKISICCLTYNHEKFCEEAIRSIWNQGRNDIEIVIVDDGSTDNTYKILSHLASISPIPMIILTQQNIYNIGKSLNRALKHSNGEYIMFLSLDDVMLDKSIDRMMKEIENTDYLFFGILFDKVNKTCLSKKDYLRISKNPTVNNLLDAEKSGGIWSISSAIYRKELIDAIGGFDEDMYGDDIVLRTKIMLYMKANKDLKFKVVVDKPTYYYRIHDNNIHNDATRQCKILEQVMNRYFPGEYSETLNNWIKYVKMKKEGKIKFFIYRLSNFLKRIFI